MIFENIKLKYKKIYHQVQIEYFQTRKPNLFEFILIQIILDHPEKDKSISEILKKDFNISETTIFNKTFAELKKIKIIKENIANSVEFIVSKSNSSFESPIKGFSIDESIKTGFIKENYVISQETKNKRFYISYDFLNDDLNFLMSNSEKGFNSSYEFEIERKINKNIEKKLFLELLRKFLNKNGEWFSQDDILKNVFFDNENVNDLNLVRLSNENNFVIAEKLINLEISSDSRIKILSEEKSILNYFEGNPQLKKELYISVIQQYQKKVREIFEPKRGEIDFEIFDSKILNYENLPVYDASEILLINNDDYFAEDKVLNFKKITRNVKYIIIYNSKANNSFQEVKDGKMIFYLNQLSDYTLNNSTISFLNFESGFTNFAFIESDLVDLDIKVPFFQKILNSESDQKNMLSNISVGLSRTFSKCLDIKEYGRSVNLFKILETLNQLDIALEVIREKLQENILEGSIFTEFGKILKHSVSEKTFQKYEEILIKILFDICNSKNYLNFPRIISNYKIINSNLFKKYLLETSCVFDIEKLIQIDLVLQEMDIDLWKFNIFGSLKVFSEYFFENKRLEITKHHQVKSNIFQSHYEFFKDFLIMNSYFYKKQYDEAAQIYLNVFSNMKSIFKNFKNIKYDFESYFILISNLMSSYYRDYDLYLELKISANIKLPIWKIRYDSIQKYNDISKRLNANMPTEFQNAPLEFKVAYLCEFKGEKSFVEQLLDKNTKNIDDIILDIYSRK
ncbi:hypothetical protein [Spiroplasma alleghenense]|uniref:Uncharacterized protein n=1 Tax=Spiroplasma alleghenense TaxID=216931 RepID=A0A345Z366_9MOLU|nr:hypothetical protein [Spiroplasma alleghenense]AXK51045.1 hypothetical protein SALLE_v1c03710 [Spiroplasma alleghenense]